MVRPDQQAPEAFLSHCSNHIVASVGSCLLRRLSRCKTLTLPQSPEKWSYHSVTISSPDRNTYGSQVDGIVEEGCNSIANACEFIFFALTLWSGHLSWHFLPNVSADIQSLTVEDHPQIQYLLHIGDNVFIMFCSSSHASLQFYRVYDTFSNNWCLSVVLQSIMFSSSIHALKFYRLHSIYHKLLLRCAMTWWPLVNCS